MFVIEARNGDCFSPNVLLTHHHMLLVVSRWYGRNLSIDFGSCVIDSLLDLILCSLLQMEYTVTCAVCSRLANRDLKVITKASVVCLPVWFPLAVVFHSLQDETSSTCVISPCECV